jgi:release factor glutamine methyltransferase
MITLREAYRNSKETLSQVYEHSEATAVVNYLFENLFAKSSKDIMLHGDEIFDHEVQLEAVLLRLKKFEPIQHVLGFEYFLGLKILVNSDVLIPRPETEELVQWIVDDEKGPIHLIVDFCTGSGCLALAMRQNFPTSNIIATDISEKAIEMGKKSEQLNFNSSMVQWVKHDLLNEDYHLTHPDVVVCNPPYIKIEEKEAMGLNVLEYEPNLALFVYNDDALLFYKRVVNLFTGKEMPKIYFELNPITADGLGLWCIEKDLNCIFKNDLSGKKRFARISK